MKKSVLFICVMSLALLYSCGNSERFEIKKGKVGHLTPKTSINELDQIVKTDSIVPNLSEGSLGDNYF